MNFKSFIPAACLGLSVLMGAGCSKEEETPYSKKDPRISFVSITGVNSRLVINDYEHKIYNTDSLAYGTDITSLPIFFSGYDVTTSIEVFSDGEWVPYGNKFNDTVKFDLSNLKIRSTSVDKSNSIEYTVALRVRKFDINSFVWTEMQSLPEGAKGGNAVSVNGVCYYFCANEGGELLCFSSADYKSWKKVSVKGAPKADGYTWNSLVVAGTDVLLPYSADGKDGVMAISGFDKSTISVSVLEANSALPKSLVGEFDGKCYGLTADSLCLRKTNGFTAVSALPVGFPTLNLNSLVVKSGSRSTIAYIYGFNGDVASLWVLDAGGKLMKLTSSVTGSTLPAVKNAAMVSVDGEIALVGGNDLSGKYLNSFFTSADAGLSWSANWHKEIPGNVGAVANVAIVPVSNSEILLIGGETEKGASSSVWRATLKGEK